MSVIGEDDLSIDISFDTNDLILRLYNSEGLMVTAGKVSLHHLGYHLERHKNGQPYSEPAE